MFKIILVLAFVSVVSCHVCLIFPQQRGGFGDINKPASSSCFKIVGPCGDNVPADPEIEFFAGHSYNITFQKNLNHWNSTDPGYFSVSYGHGINPHFSTLAKVTDTNTPPLTLYTTQITLPKIDDDHGIIRVQYISNSVGVPIFYQCADVKLRT